MKTLSLISIGCAVTILVVAGCHEARSVKSKPLELRNSPSTVLTLPKNIFKVGEPVDATITIRNTTRNVLYGMNEDFTTNYRIHLFNSENEPIGLTPAGKKIYHSPKGEHVESVSVNPGAALTDTLNISRYFDLPEGGKYDFVVERSFAIYRPDGKMISIQCTSNSVCFIIVGPHWR